MRGSKRRAPSAVVAVTIAVVASLAVLAILRTVIHAIVVELVADDWKRTALAARPGRAARPRCSIMRWLPPPCPSSPPSCHHSSTPRACRRYTLVAVAVPLSVVRCRTAPLRRASPSGVTLAPEMAAERIPGPYGRQRLPPKSMAVRGPGQLPTRARRGRWTIPVRRRWCRVPGPAGVAFGAQPAAGAPRSAETSSIHLSRRCRCCCRRVLASKALSSTQNACRQCQAAMVTRAATNMSDDSADQKPRDNEEPPHARHLP